jgi:lambda family phage portal protein
LNLIDWAVGLINPRAGLVRQHYRRELARAYEAASTKDGWKPRRPGASPNADHQADGNALRVKARSLYQNVPYITSGMDARVAHAVGHGIGVNFTGAAAATRNKAWRKWKKRCDMSGASTFDGLQKQAWLTWDVDGEVLCRLRTRDTGRPGVPPLMLQMLEVEWLDTTRDRAPDNGNQIINGIEYDSQGVKVGYWLWDQHPGDTTLRRTLRNESRRVPAAEIIHLFDPKRAQQSRGITRMHSAITRTRDFSIYEDAERARKNLEARLSVIVTQDASAMAQPDAEANRDPTSTDLGTLSSGGITSVGASGLTVVEPKAMPGYVETAKWEVHLISAGCGFTYEMATGDMREANFTQGRMRMMAFYREVEQLQWLTFIPMFIERVAEAFVEAGALNNQWSRDAEWDVECSPPRREYIQPDQEVRADLAEISGGLNSISGKLRARGDDPDKVFKQIASDIDQLKKLGVWEDLLFLQRGNLPTPQQGKDDGTEPKAQE